MSVLPLASLSDEQLAALAALHCAVMPTLLADLGFPVVRRYYQNALRDTTTIGFVARSSDKQNLLGWAFGSPHPNELAARLRESPVWFAAQMARVAFTRPRILRELMRSALAPVAENHLEADEIELTYIGIAPEARGQGIGSALLRQFLAAAHREGYARVTLSVETDNPTAIRMYQKAGFDIARTFHEGRFERHRMSVFLRTREEAR